MKLTLPKNLDVSDDEAQSILSQIADSVLIEILTELKIMNMHLSMLTNEEIEEGDV